MYYALRIGEVTVASGRVTAYLGLGDRGQVDTVMAGSDVQALAEIAARAGGEEVICEPALAGAGRALGLGSAALPDWTLAPRAELATVLDLGPDGIEPDAFGLVGHALQAARELLGAAPWAWRRDGDVIDVEVAERGASRRFEGCMVGAGDDVSIALYEQPGSVARMMAATRRGAIAAAHAIDGLALTIVRRVTSIAMTVAAVHGEPFTILPMRLRGGRLRPVTADDLSLMVAALVALSRFTEARPEATVIVEVRERELEVNARMRSATSAPATRGIRAAAPVVVAAPVARAAGPNAYCEGCRIAVPTLEAVLGHPDASNYTLLIVALLERGAPMTLAEVAARFEVAGVAPADLALASLQRCRPARDPVFRDGDRYGLDPRSAELDLWAFRLGLRPPAFVREAPPAPPPRPAADQPLTVAELDEAWRGASLQSWSAQRLALAVLDAHGRAMTGDAVLAFVAARTQWHRLRAMPLPFRPGASAVAVGADGSWSIVDGAPELRMARDAVRDAIDRARRRPRHATPDEVAALMARREVERAAHARELATQRRVLVHAFPARKPAAVVLIDVETRELTTLIGPELAEAGARVLAYDCVVGVDVRATLRALQIDPGERRLADLGPPQKTIRINHDGPPLTITLAMLIQGSCGIGRALGDPVKLRTYLDRGQLAHLRRRLEADAKALFALHEYGRLQGTVRLRWGFLDERFAAPWSHRDEPTVRDLIRQAHELGVAIEAVVGAAPGWEDPWARAQRLSVERGDQPWKFTLLGDDGAIDVGEIQLARLAVAIH